MRSERSILYKDSYVEKEIVVVIRDVFERTRCKHKIPSIHMYITIRY